MKFQGNRGKKTNNIAISTKNTIFLFCVKYCFRKKVKKKIIKDK